MKVGGILSTLALYKPGRIGYEHQGYCHDRGQAFRGMVNTFSEPPHPTKSSLSTKLPLLTDSLTTQYSASNRQSHLTSALQSKTPPFRSAVVLTARAQSSSRRINQSSTASTPCTAARIFGVPMLTLSGPNVGKRTPNAAGNIFPSTGVPVFVLAVSVLPQFARPGCTLTVIPRAIRPYRSELHDGPADAALLEGRKRRAGP